MGIGFASTGVSEPMILNGRLGRLETLRGYGFGAQLLQQRVVNDFEGVFKALGQLGSEIIILNINTANLLNFQINEILFILQKI